MLGDSEKSPSELIGPRLAVVFGFASMFVFPAIPIGRTAALDTTLVLTIALMLLHPRIIFGASFPLMALVMLPLVQSALAVQISGAALEAATMPKTLVAYYLCMLPLVSACELMRAGRLREVVLGVSLALPVHALIAVYQMIVFDREGALPLLALMATNPGMSMSSETAAGYAEFIQRPFGLFAEPSAMAACVGPWLVLIVILMANQERWPALRVHRGILILAVTAGCFLMAVSQSGQAIINIAGVTVAVLASVAGSKDASARRSRFWAFAAIAALLLVTAIVVRSSFSDTARTTFGDTALNERTASSWAGRLSSFGFLPSALLHDVWTFLFGVGPGQSYPMILLGARFAQNLPPGVSAVWSVTGGYVAEAGMVGLLCIAAIGWMAAVSIWRSSARMLGIVCSLVWLSGVLIATSHTGQPSIWFFLAVLLNWSQQLGFREVALPGSSRAVFATR
jgi:hypothetical protein